MTDKTVALAQVWLPKDLHGCTVDDLNQLGFVHVGEYTEESVLVSLPAHWHTEGHAFTPDNPAGERGLWTYLLDDKDRKRGVISRGNHERRELHWFRRFAVDVQPEKGWMDTAPIEAFVFIIRNSDREKIFTSDLIQVGSNLITEIYGQVIDAGAAWLFTHYPDWQDIGAYWD